MPGKKTLKKCQEILEVSGCEQLTGSIQCGTCSGICPLSIHMDFSPRQVMALVRADFKNEVLRSKTVWLCASCHACTVECPRLIRITDINGSRTARHDTAAAMLTHQSLAWTRIFIHQSARARGPLLLRLGAGNGAPASAGEPRMMGAPARMRQWPIRCSHAGQASPRSMQTRRLKPALRTTTSNLQLPTFNDQVRARHDTALALLPPENPCADDSRIRLKRQQVPTHFPPGSGTVD
ncbi:MAG: 4Fe-4S dicluster domain-containing protein [Verrucomicrobia bacterium]|nr:4Fe-4S dicluster domain-containing protein [Verrucomicrobiota bacterium]